MNRRLHSRQWIALAMALAVVSALAVMVVSPNQADAQNEAGASVFLTVSPPSAEQPFRTLAVDLDPGDSGLAALGATLLYDTDQILVSSCSVSEVGACNVQQENGKVLVSVFNVTRLRANEQLMTISFTPTPTAGGSTSFTMDVTTAVNVRGERLPEILAAPVETYVTEAETGALTGDVVAADTAVGLYALDVCATNDATQIEVCTTTTGLGTWRINDLPTGDYTVAITDPNGVYSPAITTGAVVADTVVAGVDVALTIGIDEPVEATAVEVPTPADIVIEPAPEVQAPPAKVIVYAASIAGRVTALDSQQTLEAMQVCATQPLVLHQSCATTDADGVFALADLSTGNYWVTVVDPLAQFEEVRPKLVGVVGDDVVRAGVEIRLTRIGE